VQLAVDVIIEPAVLVAGDDIDAASPKLPTSSDPASSPQLAGRHAAGGEL
jgi:DNA integrity scanning protein DisA with diadenylate cyclase activity